MVTRDVPAMADDNTDGMWITRKQFEQGLVGMEDRLTMDLRGDGIGADRKE